MYVQFFLTKLKKEYHSFSSFLAIHFSNIFMLFINIFCGCVIFHCLDIFFFFLSMELLGKHLNAFYFVTVINLNNSAVTIFIYESFSIFRTASPRKFPEVGFLGQMIGMSLNLEMYIFPEYFP